MRNAFGSKKGAWKRRGCIARGERRITLETFKGMDNYVVFSLERSIIRFISITKSVVKLEYVTGDFFGCRKSFIADLFRKIGYEQNVQRRYSIIPLCVITIQFCNFPKKSNRQKEWNVYKEIFQVNILSGFLFDRYVNYINWHFSV